MAKRPRDPLSVLLAGVRRRMLLSRLSASVVAGLFGCAVWLVICSVLVVLSEKIPWWFALIGLCPAVGRLLFNAFRPLPRDVTVAMHIDRSRGLDELLSSAIAMRDRSDSASVCLRAIAIDAAKQIDPSEVPVGVPSSRRKIAAALLSGAMLCVFLLVTAGRARTAVVGLADHHEPVVAKSLTDQPESGMSVTEVSRASEARPSDATREPTSDDGSSTRVERGKKSENAKASADAGQARGQTADQPKSAALAFGSTNDASVATSSHANSSAIGRDAASLAKTGDSSPLPGASVERAAIASSAARLQATPNHSVLGTAISDAPSNCRDVVRAYFDAPDETSKPIQR